MAKKNNIPEEAEALIKDFSGNLKNIAPGNEIPNEWVDSILIPTWPLCIHFSRLST